MGDELLVTDTEPRPFHQFSETLLLFFPTFCWKVWTNVPSPRLVIIMLPVKDVDNPHFVQTIPDNLIKRLVPRRSTDNHLPDLLDPVRGNRLVFERVLIETEIRHDKKCLDEFRRNGHPLHWSRERHRVKSLQIDHLSRHPWPDVIPDPPAKFPNRQRNRFGLPISQKFRVDICDQSSENLADPLCTPLFIVAPLTGEQAVFLQVAECIFERGKRPMFLVEIPDKRRQVLLIPGESISPLSSLTG